jgi:hypothetical protein
MKKYFTQHLKFSIQNNFYSVLKLFTGFINADLMAWKLTVVTAIAKAARPARQIPTIRYVLHKQNPATIYSSPTNR